METTVEAPVEETATNGQAEDRGTESITSGTSHNGVKAEATLNFDFGANLEQACEIHGDDAVFSAYCSGARNSFSNAIRTCVGKFLKKGNTAAEIPALVTADMADWKLGVTRRTGKSDTQKVLAAFPSMTAEQQKEFIAELTRIASGA